ncbi:calcium-binding protein [Celeribacter halophilus]|uniref:calcium-binding protein n=1 Tax=Celeribacter halophilus TaxID=576117 RepID=UPI003A946606
MLWALALLGLVPAALTVADLGEKAADEPDDEAQSTDGLEVGINSEMSDGGEDLLTIVDASEEDESLAAAETEIGTDTGDDYLVLRGSGEIVFSEFTAEEDHITFRLEGDGEGAFSVEHMLDENAKPIGTSLSYVTEQDETILSFPGHDVLPTGDISVERVDPESGGTVLYALSELGDFGPIAPNDPSVADEAGPEGAEDDVVLAPNDPDLPDEAAPAGREDDAVLIPEGAEFYATGASTGEVVEYVLSEQGEVVVLANDEMQGGTDARLTLENGRFGIEAEGALNAVTGGAGDDVIAAGDDAAIVNAGGGDDTIYGGDGTAFLSGGAGDDMIYAGHDVHATYVLAGGEGADMLYGGLSNDMLLLDTLDMASGGDGTDEFWLDIGAAPVGNAVVITDFAKGEDMLRITLDPRDDDTSAANVEVKVTEDGLSSQVTINGDVVAVLQAAPNVTSDDVVVEFSSETFPII